MTVPIDLAAVYEQLMAINRETFAAGHYDVAYHALDAALACARDLADADRLTTVEATAAGQLAWIDAHDPQYEHSTASARTRGHSSVFAMLAHQAGARRRMLHPRRLGPGAAE